MNEVLTFRAFDAELMTVYSDIASEALGRDYWVVVEPFVYYLGEKGSNRIVEVPAGYLTDGASVPRVFWNILPPWGRYGQAAVVHDYLCEYLTIKVDGNPQPISRKDCDNIFLEAMKVLEVPSLRRHTAHSAVALYRTLARVKKPTFDPIKFEMEEALRRRKAAYGSFT